MKKLKTLTLIFYEQLVYFGNQVLHPFAGMPLPDFNYQYDETML